MSSTYSNHKVHFLNCWLLIMLIFSFCMLNCYCNSEACPTVGHIPLMIQIRWTYASFKYAPDENKTSMFLSLIKKIKWGAYWADAKTSLSLVIIRYSVSRKILCPLMPLIKIFNSRLPINPGHASELQ